MTTIRLKRAYEPKENEDCLRVLVDRLWPRGIKKEAAHIDIWLKELAPSSALRKWFNHDIEKWHEFKNKYSTALMHSMEFQELVTLLKVHKTITLVYGAKDEKHNQAVVIKELLEKN